jgi:hypothetical protein
MSAELFGNPADWQLAIFHPENCFALNKANLTIAAIEIYGADEV